jgi:leucine-zipper of insertion element IS481
VAAVASAFEVNTRTVRKWLARLRSEGDAGLQNRSSAPHLGANKLAAPWLTMVTRLRRDYRMTGEEIAERLRLPRSTVASHLRRLGLGRLAALEPREPARRHRPPGSTLTPEQRVRKPQLGGRPVLVRLALRPPACGTGFLTTIDKDPRTTDPMPSARARRTTALPAGRNLQLTAAAGQPEPTRPQPGRAGRPGAPQVFRWACRSYT